MSDVVITGTFTGLSLPEVCEHLRRFAADEGRVPTVFKVSDSDADYEDALLEAFIQPILDDAFVSIEAEFYGSMTDARRWLDAFIATLSRQGVEADFDLLEQDEAGKMLGEMISLQTDPTSKPSPPTIDEATSGPSPRSAGSDIALTMAQERSAGLIDWLASVLGAPADGTWIFADDVVVEARPGHAPGEIVVELDPVKDQTFTPAYHDAVARVLARLREAHLGPRLISHHTEAIERRVDALGEEESWPVGRSVGGRFLLTRRLAGSAYYGLFLAKTPEGRSALVTIMESLAIHHEDVLAALSRPDSGLFTLLAASKTYLTPLNPSFFIVEATPTGAPISAPIDPSLACRLGAQLARRLAKAGARRFIGAFHPSLAYVDGDALSGLTSRPAELFFLADDARADPLGHFRHPCVAPEFLTGLVTHTSPTFLTAMTVWSWITGRSPFASHNRFGEVVRITTQRPDPFEGPTALGDLLHAGLVKDAHVRQDPLTFAAALDAISAS